MLGLSMRMLCRQYPGGSMEFWDALSGDWPRFLNRLVPAAPYVYLPNLGEAALDYVQKMGVTALVLTGGDDWGVFPPRDKTEEILFHWARKAGLPILGICRGAQIINRFMGGSLEDCQGHVACRHEIILKLPLPIRNFAWDMERREVNSFHGHCIRKDGLARGLEAFAMAEDGGVEGYCDAQGNICGIMWHPEREKAPSLLDVKILKALLET